MLQNQDHIVKQKIVGGLVTSMGARVLSMAVRIVSVLLLPLWLSPAEIGYCALIMVCVNLPIAFADLGLGTALIKKEDLQERDFYTVYSINILTALMLGLGLLYFANPLSISLNAHPLEGLIPVAVFAIPLSVLAIVPNAKLQRELRFRSLAARDFAGELAFALPSVGLASLGFGAMSVAAALVLQRLVRYVIANISVDWSPRLYIGLQSVQKLFGFSLWQIFALTLTQLFYNLDKLLLSTFLSPVSLGYYNLSLQIAVNPISSLVGTARNVFFASFARMQSNLPACRELFTKLLRYLLLLPLSISAVGYVWLHFIPAVYGSQWQAAIGVAQLLFASAVIFSFDLIEGVIIAIGGERRRVLSAALRLSVMVCGILLLREHLSPILVALILVAANAVSALLNLQFALKRLGIALGMLHQQLPLLCSLLLALGLSIGFAHVLRSPLLWQCALFSVSMLIFLAILFHKDVKVVISLLRKRR